MQIVTLDLHEFLAVQHHPVNVSGAVREPADRMTVGPDRSDPVTRFIVLVMPHETPARAEQVVRVMLAHQIADRIEEALNPAVPVARFDQSAQRIVREALRVLTGRAALKPSAAVVGHRHDLPGLVDRLETAARLVIRIARDLPVEIDLLDQSACCVVMERVVRVIRIGQRNEPPEPVVAVRQRLPQRIGPAADATARVIAVTCVAVQRIDLCQQAPFRVVAHLLAAGRRHDLDQLAILAITVCGHAARCILRLREAPLGVIRPLRRLPRAIGIADQLADVVVLQRFRAALRILDPGKQPAPVIGILGLVPERIDFRHRVSRVVVFAQPRVAKRVGHANELVLRVVRHLDHAAVGTLMAHEVAARIVSHMLDGAVAVNVLDEHVVRVPIHPLFAAVRVNHTERIALAVVVVMRDIAKRVGHADHPEIRMPCETDLVATVVGVFAEALCLRPVAVPLEVHASTGAIGVSRHEVVPIAILATIAVAIRRSDQIIPVVVLVVRECADVLALRAMMRSAHDSPPRVVSERNLRVRCNQSTQPSLGIVIERQLIAGAILDECETKRVAVTLVRFEQRMPARHRQPLLVQPQ
ncbi:hypothetical protein BPA30113_05705 [Burkholderia paludis]|uniref:Uncharacterized protein n=1 Tax=Burkholderia paludis TaxID=1506587 RepID=A0A6P2QJR6_9BURK|nr:hypothetical protein BPA30113_05705 [Burkholderia paludis]